jgi:hypothetical protein
MERVKGDNMPESEYSVKMETWRTTIVNTLNQSLRDIEYAKTTTLTDEQKERLALLEKAITRALNKINRLTQPIKLHDLVNDCVYRKKG